MPVKSAAAAPPGGFTGAGGAAFSSARDDWETPAWLFSALDSEFHFTLDAASSDANAKCERHLTKRDDGLAADWGGERVWVNPPYGRGVGAWARKAAIEGAKPRTTVALLVAARTDTEWFLRYILGHAEIRLVRGRIRFELAGVAQGPAPFPSMVAVFGEGAAPGKVSSIANAAARGGKVREPFLRHRGGELRVGAARLGGGRLQRDRPVLQRGSRYSLPERAQPGRYIEGRVEGDAWRDRRCHRRKPVPELFRRRKENGAQRRVGPHARIYSSCT